MQLCVCDWLCVDYYSRLRPKRETGREKRASATSALHLRTKPFSLLSYIYVIGRGFEIHAGI